MPDQITAVGEDAFRECSNLTSVTFSNALTSIGERVFENCVRLKTIALPDTVKTLGSDVFHGCTALTTAKLSAGLTEIPAFAFEGCSSLTAIDIPDQVTEIENYAFNDCTGLKKLNLSKSLKTIGMDAFVNCGSLTEIAIPDGVTDIQEYAFFSCNKVDILTLPASIEYVGRYAFYMDNLRAIRYKGTKADWAKIVFSTNAYDTQFHPPVIYYGYDPAHKHAYKTQILKKATCLATGLKAQICTVCGEKTSQAVIPKSGHQFTEYECIAKATVSSPEKREYFCELCGISERRSVGKKLTPKIKVNASSFSLKTKQKTTAFKVSGLANGDSIVSWKSSDPKIVKVSGKSNGTSVITAGGKTGKATITITLKSKLTKKITVKVQKSAVATTGISGLSKTLTLKKGKSTTLKPVIAPITSTDKVAYQSSNKKVATVTAKGKVTARKKGNAVITVKSGKKTVKCKVFVK